MQDDQQELQPAGMQAARHTDARPPAHTTRRSLLSKGLGASAAMLATLLTRGRALWAQSAWDWRRRQAGSPPGAEELRQRPSVPRDAGAALPTPNTPRRLDDFLGTVPPGSLRFKGRDDVLIEPINPRSRAVLQHSHNVQRGGGPAGPAR